MTPRTYTTHEAMSRLQVKRAGFHGLKSRHPAFFVVLAPSLGGRDENNKGNQTQYDAEQIDRLVEIRQLMKGSQS